MVNLDPIAADDKVPLFVDLDGTLVKSDLLVESTLELLKRAPWSCFVLLFWLLHGRALLKLEVARRVTLDTDSLPLQSEFLKYLEGEAAGGRAIYLATASDHILAEPLGRRVGIFAGILASNGKRNLKGGKKLEAILATTKGGCFDYAGNDQADLPIWSKARRAIVVNPHRGVTEAARKRCTIERVFDDRPPAWRTWFLQMRLYQWSKNILVGVPLLTAHAFDARSLIAALAAFLCFGCVASAAYLLNDLIDLPSDRRHPRKCRRPFAAGDLSLITGLVVMVVLLGAGFIVAALQSLSLLFIMLVYLTLTLSYSLHLKRIVLLDVFVLASLYTLRIIAGAIAIQVEMSSWLMAFSMFTFLSLALVKRSSELVTLERISRSAAINRDYRVADNNMVTAMGVAAGYLSVVVLALYVDSPFGHAKYTHPGLLWLLCPVMLYWVSRLWFKTARGEMHDDPLMFSLRDRASWMTIAAMVLVMLAAM